MTVLADFILLGHQKVGALRSARMNGAFAMAIGAFLDIICEAFNSQGIPSLVDINGRITFRPEITDYQKMVHRRH